MKYSGPWFYNQIHLLDELINATIQNNSFNPDEWSIADAETIITIGNMIKREIKMKEKRK